MGLPVPSPLGPSLCALWGLMGLAAEIDLLLGDWTLPRFLETITHILFFFFFHHPYPCFPKEVLYVGVTAWSLKLGKVPQGSGRNLLRKAAWFTRNCRFFKLSTNEVTRQKTAKVSGASHFTLGELSQGPQYFKIPILTSVLSMFVLQLVRRRSLILGE